MDGDKLVKLLHHSCEIVDIIDDLIVRFAVHAPGTKMSFLTSHSAILVTCKSGWAFDHCKAITESVSGSGYRCPAHLFHINQPYFFGSNDRARQGNAPQSGNNTRKRKRPKTATQSHNIIDFEHAIETEARQVIELLQNCTLGTDKWSNQQCTFNDYKPIIDSIDFVGLSDLAKRCHTNDGLEGIYNLTDDNNFVTTLISKVVRNISQTCIILTALQSKFLIPPCSTFLVSDIEHIGKLLTIGQKYDFIVIDPPWSNKSAKRARKYKSLSFHDIKSLPIKDFASCGTLLAVWVTNKKKVIDFVLQELFPTWSIQLIGKWYWIKITTTGEFVCNFDSTHKKPYECILIGYHNKFGQFKNSQLLEMLESFPFHKIICSVPCRLHSRKPVLYEFFTEFLADDSKCLELFARCLTPGWTSWGNEVLKYQNINYFEAFQENSDKIQTCTCLSQ